MEGNEELLKNIPYHQIEDLALTYYILVERNEEGTGKALLSNSWLESIGVSQEQLHQDALENSPKLFSTDCDDNAAGNDGYHNARKRKEQGHEEF